MRRAAFTVPRLATLWGLLLFLVTISFAALNYLTRRFNQLPREDDIIIVKSETERSIPLPLLIDVPRRHDRIIIKSKSTHSGLLLLDQEEEGIPVPAVITQTQYDVKCSRKFYCNPSNCQPVHIKRYTKHAYREIESKFFRADENNNRTINIQYWGDSTSATMECDMRQWIHDISVGRKKNINTTDTLTTTITTNYRTVGCPWWNCTPDVNWGGLVGFAEDADLIIFNIGAHYELGKDDDSLPFEKRASAFDIDIDRYYDPLQQILAQEDKIVLVRGPSPTHFDTEDGIIEEDMLSEARKRQYEYSCVPLRKIPPVVQRQEQGLRFLANRLKSSTRTAGSSSVDYLDVYELTRDRYMEHTDDGRKLDCKHYCQNCGILRAWNALAVDYIISR